MRLVRTYHIMESSAFGTEKFEPGFIEKHIRNNAGIDEDWHISDIRREKELDSKTCVISYEVELKAHLRHADTPEKVYSTLYRKYLQNSEILSYVERVFGKDSRQARYFLGELETNHVENCIATATEALVLDFLISCGIDRDNIKINSVTPDFEIFNEQGALIFGIEVKTVLPSMKDIHRGQLSSLNIPNDLHVRDLRALREKSQDFERSHYLRNRYQNVPYLIFLNNARGWINQGQKGAAARNHYTFAYHISIPDGEVVNTTVSRHEDHDSFFYDKNFNPINSFISGYFWIGSQFGMPVDFSVDFFSHPCPNNKFEIEEILSKCSLYDNYEMSTSGGDSVKIQEGSLLSEFSKGVHECENL